MDIKRRNRIIVQLLDIINRAFCASNHFLEKGPSNTQLPSNFCEKLWANFLFAVRYFCVYQGQVGDRQLVTPMVVTAIFRFGKTKFGDEQ